MIGRRGDCVTTTMNATTPTTADGGGDRSRTLPCLVSMRQGSKDSISAAEKAASGSLAESWNNQGGRQSMGTVRQSKLFFDGQYNENGKMLCIRFDGCSQNDAKGWWRGSVVFSGNRRWEVKGRREGQVGGGRVTRRTVGSASPV